MMSLSLVSCIPANETHLLLLQFGNLYSPCVHQHLGKENDALGNHLSIYLFRNSSHSVANANASVLLTINTWNTQLLRKINC